MDSTPIIPTTVPGTGTGLICGTNAFYLAVVALLAVVLVAVFFWFEYSKVKVQFKNVHTLNEQYKSVIDQISKLKESKESDTVINELTTRLNALENSFVEFVNVTTNSPPQEPSSPPPQTVQIPEQGPPQPEFCVPSAGGPMGPPGFSLADLLGGGSSFMYEISSGPGRRRSPIVEMPHITEDTDESGSESDIDESESFNEENNSNEPQKPEKKQQPSAKPSEIVIEGTTKKRK
jgi:hypothetical protein